MHGTAATLVMETPLHLVGHRVPNEIMSNRTNLIDVTRCPRRFEPCQGQVYRICSVYRQSVPPSCTSDVPNLDFPFSLWTPGGSVSFSLAISLVASCPQIPALPYPPPPCSAWRRRFVIVSSRDLNETLRPARMASSGGYSKQSLVGSLSSDGDSRGCPYCVRLSFSSSGHLLAWRAEKKTTNAIPAGPASCTYGQGSFLTHP